MVLGLLGGSWVVISGVTSPLTWVISIVTLLITLLITSHEPPSMVQGLRVQDSRVRVLGTGGLWLM